MTAFVSPVSTKGLPLGAYSLQLEYEYSPAVRPLERTVAGRKIAAMIARDDLLIRDCFERLGPLAPRYGAIPADTTDPAEPRWNDGGWLPAFDAIMLYGLVADRAPTFYLEVGSGSSTKFVRRAIQDFGLSTRIVSIDPHPRTEIDALCDEVIRSPVEALDLLPLVSRLGPRDVVFVDNSHRAFQNSDGTVCLLELLPVLPVGVAFGVHDICLPYDYDPCYLDYFYSEQYVLGAYLLGGADRDRILMPTYYAGRSPDYAALCWRAMDLPGIPVERRGGASFWMLKG
jgi:hypothetical protein